MFDINEELTKDELWEKIVYECETFLYADNGVVTISLIDPELTQYNFDFDKIRKIIYKLKYYEEKFNGLNNDEKECLLKYKEKFLDINTPTNGINDIYRKLFDLYENIE